MAMLKKCCCQLSLKTGALVVIYSVLTREVLLCLVMLFGLKEPMRSILVTNESDAFYFHLWIQVFNILVVITALYAVYKQKPACMIPFLAYRTVSLIFSIFTLMSARDIANSLNESLENSLHNERDETFDTLPLVVIAIITSMCIELYFLIVVCSYYQTSIINMTVVAVATVPVLAYTVPTYDNNAHMYAQPPVNPYLFEAKNPYQYQEPHSSLGVQYYYTTQPDTSHVHIPTVGNTMLPQPAYG